MLALIKHTLEFGLWIIAIFYGYMKSRINPQPAAGGKEAERIPQVHDVHDLIRFTPFLDQIYSVCHCLARLVVKIFINKMYLI